MPVVAVNARLPDQVRTDAARAPQRRVVQRVVVLFRVADPAEAGLVAADRTHLLRVAVPAAFADVHLAAQFQRLGQGFAVTFVAKRFFVGVGVLFLHFEEIERRLGGQFLQRLNLDPLHRDHRQVRTDRERQDEESEARDEEDE